MAPLSFHTLDVFTSRPYHGNPLAIVLIPPSTSLPQEAKLRIAREFNLSETVFLHMPPDPTSTTLRIDIFLTTGELPFAGHPTIGAANLVLRQLGWAHITTLLTKAGRIDIRKDGDGVTATIPQAVNVHHKTLGDVLGNQEGSVDAVTEWGLSTEEGTRRAELDAPIVDIVKGMAFVLVRVNGLKELGRVSMGKGIDSERVKGLLDGVAGRVRRYHYVVTKEEEGDGAWKVQVRTRNVDLGFEDPATGSAACALAGYLSLKKGRGGVFEVVQGVEMGRTSEIGIETLVERVGQGMRVKEIYMSGKAVAVMKGEILA
jgi:pre-mRNA-processing factor 19